MNQQPQRTTCLNAEIENKVSGLEEKRIWEGEAERVNNQAETELWSRDGRAPATTFAPIARMISNVEAASS